NNIVNYEADADFAMTVEVIAWLKPKAATGPIEYYVVGGCVGAPLGKINGGPIATNLINGDDILGLETEDVYGNKYYGALNGSDAVTSNTRKNGSVIYSIRRAVRLKPLSANGTTYPHLLGVVAF